MINTHIVIIDDNIPSDDPLIRVLEKRYTEKNVHLFDTSQDGLNYLLSNLNQHMVVLLDIRFPANEKNGHTIFKELREKTELIPVVIWTANECTPSELIDFLKKHAFSFVKQDASTKEIILELEKAIQSTSSNVDVAVEEWLAKQNNKDATMLVSKSGKSYTANELLREIRGQTDEGKHLANSINKLTIDLLFRGKEKI
jgi:DNA-binding NtrC family response regulator